MEKVKNTLPTKSFFRGVIACLILTQFLNVEVNFRLTDSYYSVKETADKLNGGYEVNQEISDISVVPDVFAVLGE